MDYALVLISVFAVFIPALILPGPDFVAVVRSSMTYGTRAGLMTTLGVSMGLCLYATLSLLGLSAILVEYQWLTWAVRVLGGAYLIYLGIKLLRAKPQAIDLDQPMRRAGTPTTSAWAGTSRLTTAPAPTKAYSPIVVPQTMVQLAPSVAPRCTRVRRYSCLRDTAERGLSTLVKTMLGPQNTSSSSVTAS